MAGQASGFRRFVVANRNFTSSFVSKKRRGKRSSISQNSIAQYLGFTANKLAIIISKIFCKDLISRCILPEEPDNRGYPHFPSSKRHARAWFTLACFSLNRPHTRVRRDARSKPSGVVQYGALSSSHVSMSVQARLACHFNFKFLKFAVEGC